MNVRYTYLDRQYSSLRPQIMAAMDDIFMRAAFILRPEVAAFEKRVADFLGVAETVGVNSGTDALYLGVRALGLPAGSEVITVAHTFVSSVGAIVHAGLRPVLVDIAGDFNIDPALIEAAITPNTRAIMVVHMNGRVCEMDKIAAIAARHNLIIIEDAAQAIGARYNGKAAGSFGRWGAFSLHPMKILGAGGDGGLLATSDAEIAAQIRMYRNIGQRERGTYETFGFNSRLDTLQAAVCLVKMDHLASWIERRRELAGRYDAALRTLKGLMLPPGPKAEPHYDVYSSYVVCSQARDALRAHLTSAGIETMISWWPPLHRQANLKLDGVKLPVTERISAEVLALPIDSHMTNEEQDYVIDHLRKFNG